MGDCAVAQQPMRNPSSHSSMLGQSAGHPCSAPADVGVGAGLPRQLAMGEVMRERMAANA
jgi:hypothetical protein